LQASAAADMTRRSHIRINNGRFARNYVNAQKTLIRCAVSTAFQASPMNFMPQVMSYYVWAVVEHPGKTKLAVSGLENPLL
jgi:hypothetical protein